MRIHVNPDPQPCFKADKATSSRYMDPFFADFGRIGNLFVTFPPPPDIPGPCMTTI